MILLPFFFLSLSELLLPKQIAWLFGIRQRHSETCKQGSNFNLKS